MTRYARIPPFKAGGIAYRAGVPQSGNPFDRSEPFSPDDYPGRHADWRAGWMTAKYTNEHKRRNEHG